MSKRILKAPAKLTLELRIVATAGDSPETAAYAGYHLVDAEMVALDFCDELEIEEISDTTNSQASRDSQTSSSLEITEVATGSEALSADLRADNSDNLILRALDLAERTAKVHLTKRIPAGAGLGGGSADAAAILLWSGMKPLLADGRPDQEALAKAASLGADVPFCLFAADSSTSGRARVQGIGEKITPLPKVPATYTLLTPPFGCSTPQVYQKWDEMGGPAGNNGNDLEPAALAAEPRLAKYRDRLSELSGETPRLAGSGSTWFVEGAFPHPDCQVVRAL